MPEMPTSYATSRLATQPVGRILMCVIALAAVVLGAVVAGLPGSATAAPRARVSHRHLAKQKVTAKHTVRVMEKEAPAPKPAVPTRRIASVPSGSSGASVPPASAQKMVAGSTAATTSSTTRLAPNQLKIMNYYPSRTPWNAMWTSYNHLQIDSDMAAIASLGANTVRIIVQPYAVGWPVVSSSGAAEFADILNTASAHGLSTMLTLFDGWGTYNQVAASEQWISSLLGKYTNDPRISLVEVQNELPYTRAGAISWAQTMLTYLHTVAPSIPRTISFSGNLSSSALTSAWSSFPAQYSDVVDAHLYGSYRTIRGSLAAATSMAGGRPVIVGEAGISTGTSTSSGAQENQAAFYQQLQRICAGFGIPVFAPWILSDIDGGPGQQQTFGLRTVDGTWKLAASVVRSMFSTGGARALSATDTTTNLLADPNFTYANPSADSNNSIGAWTLTSMTNVAAAGSMSVDSGRAGFLRGANADSAGWPSIGQQTVLDGERSLRLQASVRLISGTGTSRIGLWFYDANGNTVGHIDSAAANNSTSGWQTLSTTIAVPAGAFIVVSSLKSAGNSGTAEFTNVQLTSAG